jgi:hypothetical protein
MGDGAGVKLPLFTSLRGYDSGWLRGDVVAGLTVWAVLVPEALAYASIAGVSPVVGLYAAPGALLLYAAFGSSRHLVVGPMSATAALSAAAVADVATQGSAGFAAHTAALAITTGILAVAAGLLRLGFLASFISEPVLKGFIIRLALTIAAGQLPDLFGVEGAGGDFFERLWGLLADLDQTSLTTLAVGLASLALVLGLRRFARPCPAPWSTLEVPEFSAANIRGRSYKILAEVQLADPDAQGVILAQGARFGGHALFIKDRKLWYVYNFIGIPPEQQLVADRELEVGNRVLGVEFTKERLGERHETHGTARLYVDDQVVAEGPLRTQPGHFALAGEGLSVGRDTGDSVSKEYTPQFPFTGGRIIKVEVSIGDDVYLDIEREFAAAMARD